MSDMLYDEYNLGVMELVERLEQQREHERQEEDRRFVELTKETVTKAQTIIEEYEAKDVDFSDQEACMMHSEKLKGTVKEAYEDSLDKYSDTYKALSDIERCVDRQYSTVAEPESNVVSLEQEATKIKKQFEIDEWKDNR